MIGPVQLELAAGHTISIQGKSGAGKSTLLRCIARLESRCTGTVFYNGHRISGAEVPLYRRRVVYLPQTPSRLSMVVRDSLSYSFSFASAKNCEYDHSRAMRLCQQMLLPDDIMERSLPQVSGGEAQRLSLIRALLLDPTVLLLDEPTSALDAASCEALMSVLLDWMQGGERGIISVSHGVEILPQLPKIDLYMANGQMSKGDA